MKGTEKIIAHIQSDAKAQADAILGKAKEQCAAISKDYEAKAQAVYSEKVRAGEKDCEDKVESSERICQMESKIDMLSVKQEMISKVFDLAAEKLLALSDSDYSKLLTKLIVASASEGNEQVVLNASDKKKFGAEVIKAANEQIKGGKLVLSDEEGDFKGGVILKRGSVEVNNTLELLMDLARSEMSADIAKVLFA